MAGICCNSLKLRFSQLSHWRNIIFFSRFEFMHKLAASTTNMASLHIKERFDDIIKSDEDKRSYRGLVLNNSMKIMLVSDPETDKSAAALDVHIGSMTDPRDIPGLAHFCEHMLFMGTEKYPAENEYQKFLTEHGGGSNAYTSDEHTNFYFDIAPEHFPEILDRFAQFFQSPLFNEDSTSREVKAVHSENEKNLQHDMWRLNQLDKSLCSSAHDFSKFGTGNHFTLSERPSKMGVDVREELLKFHDKHYSSNIMSLAVLGKESLDELMEMVIPMFCQVRDKQVAVPRWEEHPYGPDQLKMKALVVPVKDLRALHVTWPIPDLEPYWESKPGHYLGHLIGHEGPGSLLSELKARGWVNTLVGGEKSGASGFSFFMVNVDLTEEGIDHVDDIVHLIFQYIKLLQEEGPQAWVFQECQKLGEMSFRFKDKERPQSKVTSLADTLHEPFPMTEVLCGPYHMKKFEPDIIKMLLDLLTPNKVRIAVIGKKYESVTDKEEEWYKTQYKVEQIDSNTLQKWGDASKSDKLALPPVNEFIPSSFTLVEREEDNEFPVLLTDSNMCRLWYKQDHTFLLPKADVHLEFISPLVYQDPTNNVLLHMFDRLFHDSLNEYAYAAELAGLSYSLASSRYGMELSVHGYNDKLKVLVRKIMEKMVTFKVDGKRFEILKEVYMRSLRNFQAEQPYQQASYYTNMLLAERFWTKEELLDAAQDVSAEQLQMFIPDLLKRLFIEGSFYGNITKKEALSIYEDEVLSPLLSTCNTRPVLPEQLLRHRELQIPNGSHYTYEQSNGVHPTHCLDVCYQCGQQETRHNVLLELFAQLISEHCFHVLRTTEQLGYLVHSGVRRSHGTQCLRLLVQSSKHPQYLDTRVEAFLHEIETYIKDMSLEEFNKHVASLIVIRLEKAKKMYVQGLRYWSEILSQQYNFNRDNIEVEELKKLTKEDVISFYKDLLAFDAPHRHKLSVHVVSTATKSHDDGGGGGERVDDVDGKGEVPSEQLEKPPDMMYKDEVISNLMEFKKSLGLFPLAKPYINLPPLGMGSGAGKSKL